MSDTSTGLTSVDRIPDVEPIDTSVDRQHLVVQRPLADRLRRATSLIAPLWRLEDYVAVNPYLGMTDLRFSDAAQRLDMVAGVRSTLPAAFYLDAVERGRITRDDLVAAISACEAWTDDDPQSVIDGMDDEGRSDQVRTVAELAAAASAMAWDDVMVERVSAWASAYFDGGQAIWRSTDRALAPFASWRQEAAVDRTLDVMGLRGFRRWVAGLPDDPVAAAAVAVEELGVTGQALDLYLHALQLRVGGWAAFAGRVTWDARRYGHDDDTAVEFLAVLLCWEAALLASCRSSGLDLAWGHAVDQTATAAAGAPGSSALWRALVLQDAFDRSEQRRLVESFERAADAVSTAGPGAASRRPRAQAVFCIDVRSEVVRRHLEQVAPDVDTIGFAGFFGIPIEHRPLAHDAGVEQCPVLLTPGHVVGETLPDPSLHREAVEARQLAHQVRRAWKSFKMGAISCFSFVGPVGLIYLPKLFSDGFGRTRPVRRPEVDGIPSTLAAQLRPDLGPVAEQPGTGVPLEDRVALARGALRSMSLTDGFAPVVMVVGHGATTINNPYENGLACGACGGHSGEVNARVTAMILNDAGVRTALAADGIVLPDDTWFVAALHDTTTDRFTVFDPSEVPDSHRALLLDIESDLAEAGRRARSERACRLGVRSDAADLDARVIGRSSDWAQVRPEWGLAGCRAFIAAPRGRTVGLDLEGRSFLHSYDWRSDDGFGVLELIMTAPMVVASWISLQYYASTVDNRSFGSGNKTLHNVVGKVGVLEGTSGDLRTGLPWQSIHDGERYQHEPIRLNVVIEAPTDAMADVISRNDGVRDLLDNGWLNLFAMDDRGRIGARYAGDLRWDPVGAVDVREPLGFALVDEIR